MIELIASEIPAALLDGFIFNKELNCLFAIKKLAKLSKQHGTQETFEACMRKLKLVDRLIESLTTSIINRKTTEACHLVVAQLLAFLLENSTDLYLKDLFIEDIARPSIAERLNSILSMVASNMADDSDKLMLQGHLYQVFQISTEIPEIACLVLNNQFYSKLLAPPMNKYGKTMPNAECPMIYIDKMLILINLAQYAEETNYQFEDAVRSFFTIERFMALKDELARQSNSSFLSKLTDSSQMNEEEIKHKGKKHKKEQD